MQHFETLTADLSITWRLENLCQSSLIQTYLYLTRGWNRLFSLIVFNGWLFYITSIFLKRKTKDEKRQKEDERKKVWRWKKKKRDQTQTHGERKMKDNSKKKERTKEEKTDKE